ncbi:ubiquitin carboxyl-terminal hydrolase [Plectosphaerella plurivora]|uniref:Ubiquitin carboxyl-terminal hydrolase n=1 Tax=Plectosphaerella plurivora TaxID=936078 RepID=A0A9P9AG94_9PEZI|nr:ubiquitin carboxyl-terminal hydrolase [Plectosphaerella plurivora]
MSHYQQPYYQQQQLHHQYHQPAPYQTTPSIPNPYQNQYYQQQQQQSPQVQQQQPYGGRSPPPMQQFVPMAGVTVGQQYPVHHQHASPALATPYQPPPMPVAPAVTAPVLPQTPTSTHSSQFVPPASHSPSVAHVDQISHAPPAPVAPVAPQVETPVTPQSSVRSMARTYDEDVIPTPSNFRAPLPWLSRPDLPFPKRRTRRRKKTPAATSTDDDEPETLAVSLPVNQSSAVSDEAPEAEAPAPPKAVAASPEEPNRPTTSASNASGSEVSARLATSRPAVPAIPVVPALPKSSPKATKTETESAAPAVADAESAAPQEDASPAKPAPRAPPSSWSALFAKRGGPPAKAQSGDGEVAPAEAESPDAAPASTAVPAPAVNGNTVAAALQAYRVGQPERVKYIKPRGLVNSGNMCYMNSILQVLIYCTPFYDFLDQVSRKASHSFKSQTPILDAMILFMKEFPVIQSAESPAALRKILRQEDLVQYDDSFVPEFIYRAIEPEKRFENMRRGHQQDAQEFFGLLLQSLEDECSKVIGSAANGSNGEEADASGADGWLEVGSKQKAAVTRTSGASSSTPINQIFGGLLRSELMVTGRQNSITTEPYQSLALDVGAPNVRNVVDAIRQLTYGEKLEGDGFDTDRGRNVSVTKQTLIDTLPPVLILHLKRFQFDATGGISKIWKKIGYPLELEIPASALSKQWRAKQIPRYKLMAVVYHHGRQATGGHYTVDVRRQDDVEWVRLDDTSIRRVSSDDVVEKEEAATKGGVPQAQQQSSSRDASVNRFGAINDEDGAEQGEWTAVDKANGTKNAWKGAAANGKTTQHKENVRDNKVAYLLFYQRV